MLTFTDDELAEKLEQETGERPDWRAHSFSDVEADVRDAVERISRAPSFRGPTACGALSTRSRPGGSARSVEIRGRAAAAPRDGISPRDLDHECSRTVVAFLATESPVGAGHTSVRRRSCQLRRQTVLVATAILRARVAMSTAGRVRQAASDPLDPAARSPPAASGRRRAAAGRLARGIAPMGNSTPVTGARIRNCRCL
jgi:hypothetical protein